MNTSQDEDRTEPRNLPAAAVGPVGSVAASLDAFERSLPVVSQFADVADGTLYAPLPPRWLVGTADVVDSTGAIAAGNYKAVNLVGAAVITAVRNALGTRQLAFVFGGDGAAFVVPAEARNATTKALASVRRWARLEMGLTLRVALVPAADIRAAGHDIRLARFAVSEHAAYAMFSGGGLAWAEAQMKAGAFALPVEPNAEDSPDLTGLSCRWRPIPSRRGRIVSLVVTRQPRGSESDFNALVRALVGLVGELERDDGRPISLTTAQFGLSHRAIGLESHIKRGRSSHALRWLSLASFHAFGWAVFKLGRKFGRFDPAHYRQQTVRNTDFRKYDDGLKMTIDCAPQTLDALRHTLEQARLAGIADFGLYSQETAHLTCIVLSALADDHIHFIDGADGGYAKASELLKAGR